MPQGRQPQAEDVRTLPYIPSLVLTSVSCCVQEKAAAEVATVQQGRQPQAEDVRSLPYIEAVVLESLRLFSPAYMVGRCAQQDTELQGWRLQAGTTVLVRCAGVC